MTGARIRQERLNRGLSQAAFAEQIGVTQRVVQAAEDGRAPHPANALKIADALGTTVTGLWPVDGSPVEQPESGAAA